jgi:hypothetical protein
MKPLTSGAILLLLGTLIFLNRTQHAYAQSTPSPTTNPTDVNSGAVMAGMADWSFWGMLLVAAAFGMLGGLVYELLILQGNIELPHKPIKEELEQKYPYAAVANLRDWGIFARLIVGATAALALLLILPPQTPVALIATAIIAGSAGTAIFRSLQDRILATLAIKEASDTRAASAEAQMKVEQAQQTLASMRTELTEGRSLAGGVPSMDVPGMGSAPDMGADLQSRLNEVDNLLSEAKGMHRRIQN